MPTFLKTKPKSKKRTMVAQVGRGVSSNKVRPAKPKRRSANPYRKSQERGKPNPVSKSSRCGCSQGVSCGCSIAPKRPTRRQPCPTLESAALAHRQLERRLGLD